MLKLIMVVASVLVWQVLGSCTTKVEGLQVSEAFTFDALLKDRFLIGGVTQVGDENVEKVSSQYVGVLRNQLIEEREQIKIGPAAEFNALMGSAPAKSILEGYNRTGSIDAATMNQMAAKIQNYRFAVFARIENDSTEVSRHETSGREIEDAKGNKRYEPGEVAVNHERRILASMFIVDLKQKDVAFSGSVTKSHGNRSSYTKSLGGTIVSVVQAAKGNDPYPAPPAPSSVEVLNRVFKGFAENFPEED